MTPWQPTPEDVAWAENLFSFCREGATWGMPVNGNVYQIYPTTKRVVLVSGIDDSTHWRFTQILKVMGWTLEGIPDSD